MSRLNFAALLSTAVLCACPPPGEPEPPPPVNECEGLSAMSLRLGMSKVRVKTAVELVASGGSGRYLYAVADGGSGGEVRGDRFITGPTPGTDTLTAADDCGGSAMAQLQVVGAFEVAPTRATVKPGTRFKVEVKGTVGMAEFRAGTLASGGSLSATGDYLAGGADAGAGPALDLITVRDSATGDEVLLQFRVSADAALRGAPARLAAPTGSFVPLALADGSGHVTWAKRSGPGTLSGDRLTFDATATGKAVLEATDRFTQEKTTVEVVVLEELQREQVPRGRLGDFGTTAVGDFDGDGFQDLALGVPDSDLAKPQGGVVLVYRGSATGLSNEPTWRIEGDSDTAALGSVLAAGDLDEDGKADLAISAPGADVTISDSGAVLLYRFTADGPQRIREPLTGLGRGNFGAALAIADVDGDGDADLIVGSPGADLAPTAQVSARGVVDVFQLERGKQPPDLGTARVGGVDLALDGGVKPTAGLRFGRAVVVADLNDDGKADLASFGQVNVVQDGGVAVPRANTPAIAVHFGRAQSSLFDAIPDVYVVPVNPADGNEGTLRLGTVPKEAGRPPLLMVVGDRLDSPDLSAMGGVRSGGDSGGALLFDLTAFKPQGPAGPAPALVTRDGAWARLYGDAAGIAAGRGFWVADLDGQPGQELILGAPFASAPVDGGSPLSTSGKVLAFPLASLSKGAVVNTPALTRFGAARMDALGAAVAVVNAGGPRLAAFASRASPPPAQFTGRLDVFAGTGALSSWMVSSSPMPAKVSGEQFGGSTAVAVVNGQVRAAVGALGYSGPGPNVDGNEPGAGRAYLYAAGMGARGVVANEGAATPYTPDGGIRAYGGRTIGADVAFTDFDDDGRPDLVVAAPNLSTPATSTTEFAQNKASCFPTATLPDGGMMAAGAQTNGGVLVKLAKADGTFQEGFRIWALRDIPGCTPVGSAACQRSQLGRNGVVGGFDFDNDGTQDLAVTRTNGVEVFGGRKPDDLSLAKPSMACDPLWSSPAFPQASSSLTSVGDVNGDGCDDLAVRSSDGARSAVVLMFGFSTAGACGTDAMTPSMVRLAADGEVMLNNLQLGVAIARAGRVRGGAIDYLAVTANLYPYLGVPQPTVLLFETAKLSAKRVPGNLTVLVSALGEGVDPVPVVHELRAPQLGRALWGNVDVTGDGVVDLIASAPGASVNGDGSGAIFVFAGGPQLEGPQPSAFTIVGDGAERGALGQDLSVVGGAAPAMCVGAPASYRASTANGTAWLLGL